MKKYIVVAVLCCLTACGSVEQIQEPNKPIESEQDAALFEYTDLMGDQYSKENELEIVQRFVYARKSSGYFVDSVSYPNLFAEDGFQGEREVAGVQYEWKRYFPSSNITYDNFRIHQAASILSINKDGMTENLREQYLNLNDVSLKGILKLTTEFEGSNNSYGLNYNAGDIYFFPYPDIMGEFPMLILEYPDKSYKYKDEAGGYAPLLISAEKSDYQAWADTVRIKIDDLSDEQIAELFKESDLIEVNVNFSQLEFLHMDEFPLYSSAKIETIRKSADL